MVSHDEDLKYRILYEAHDTAKGGHFGRERPRATYARSSGGLNCISGSAHMCARMKRVNGCNLPPIQWRLWQVYLFPMGFGAH